MAQSELDRYVSFLGIDCDQKACRILSTIQQYLEAPPHPSPWVDYFRSKLCDRTSLGQDELFFVGSQINSIRALFEEYDDAEALSLLECIEDDCC